MPQIVLNVPGHRPLSTQPGQDSPITGGWGAYIKLVVSSTTIGWTFEFGPPVKRLFSYLAFIFWRGGPPLRGSPPPLLTRFEGKSRRHLSLALVHRAVR